MIQLFSKMRKPPPYPFWRCFFHHIILVQLSLHCWYAFDFVDFINDPLCLTGPITARTANQLLLMIDALQWPSKNTNKVDANLSSLCIPFHVQHGVKDLACPISGTRMLVEATSRLLDSQKRFLAHKNAWHGLLHEAEWERTCECVLEYIDDRLQHLSQSSILDW